MPDPRQLAYSLEFWTFKGSAKGKKVAALHRRFFPKQDSYTGGAKPRFYAQKRAKRGLNDVSNAVDDPGVNGVGPAPH